MTTKNLEFSYRENKETKKSTWLTIPIEYTQEAKTYPNRCELKSDYIAVGSELGCYQIATIAQRLILFTDALGLHNDRLGRNLTYSFYGCYGMDHQAHFTAGKKARVVLDSPYARNELNSHEWRSVWLPRSSDPYLPGVTYGRLSIHNTSTANLDELVERVSHLNFDLLSLDTTSQEHAAWLKKMNPKPKEPNHDK